MEAELLTFMKVSASVASSMSYARFASNQTPPGPRRLLALLPIITLLPILPFSFTTIHLRLISAFFIAWLAIFKLILLALDLPPLSPSLPLPTFIAIASLPLKLTPTPTSPPRCGTNIIIRALLLAALIPLYSRPMHPYLLLSIYCLHLCLALEIVLAFTAFMADALLGLDLDPQFDSPYKAASLTDFWGRRWNLMVTGILRPSVYVPVRARWGTAAGVLSTFLVSGIMHEVMFFYASGVGPTWEVTGFFVLHGVCVVVEGRLRRAGWRRPPDVVAVALTLGFVAVTGFWLFFPPILRSGADKRVVEECTAMVGFLEETGRELVGRLVLLSDRIWTAVQ